MCIRDSFCDVHVKSAQYYRQELDTPKGEGAILRGVSLQEGLDYAMILELSDNDLDRVAT